MPKKPNPQPGAALHYQIVLYHDGEKCAAIVPELAGCRATGASYTRVLENVEKAIRRLIAKAAEAGLELPAPSADFVLRPVTSSPGVAAPIMRRLHHKFGILNNRQLAERMGVADVSIQSFASSAAGQGTRTVRCAIAHELDELPSKLWPERPLKMRKRDDEQHAKQFGAIGK